ncbi:DEK isoform X1, partial [Sigmodon hispidus]
GGLLLRTSSPQHVGGGREDAPAQPVSEKEPETPGPKDESEEEEEEEEDDEDEEEEKEKSLIVEGKREKKKVERLTMQVSSLQKEPFTIEQGKCQKLCEIERIHFFSDANVKKADSSITKKNQNTSKKESASEDSSDDEPLIKKLKKPPTDEEIKETVKKLLADANLEEVTMKQICKE